MANTSTRDSNPLPSNLFLFAAASWPFNNFKIVVLGLFLMVTNVGSQLRRTLLRNALKLTRVFTEPYFQRSWNCFTSSHVLLKLSCQCGLSAQPLPLQPFSNFRWPHSLLSMSHSSHLAKGSSRVSNYLFMAFSGCASSGIVALACASQAPMYFKSWIYISRLSGLGSWKCPSPFVLGNDLRRRHTAAPVPAAPATPSAAAPAPARSQLLQAKAMNQSMPFAGDAANTSMTSQTGDSDPRNASLAPGQRPTMPGGHLQRSESTTDRIFNQPCVEIIDL